MKPFALPTEDGGTFRYPEDAKGKLVLLSFWASWCPECKVELPELVRVRKKYAKEPFLLLAVNMDRKRRGAERFLKKHRPDLRILFDNDQELIKRFSPVGVPVSYLIGPDGRVAKVYLGFQEDFIQLYQEDIDRLLRQQRAARETGDGG